MLYLNHKDHQEHEANQQTLVFVSFVFFVVIRYLHLARRWPLAPIVPKSFAFPRNHEYWSA
jgi:hypothetical protein